MAKELRWMREKKIRVECVCENVRVLVWVQECVQECVFVSVCVYACKSVCL